MNVFYLTRTIGKSAVVTTYTSDNPYMHPFVTLQCFIIRSYRSLIDQLLYLECYAPAKWELPDNGKSILTNY